ncbi:hypothetical protein BGZ54_006530 [Gamsiella multidivaricata]|nr:hypothetical protein BGZ54_006530 [Gamsiella multidivaricata]
MRKSALPALDILSRTKVGASVSPTNGSSHEGETAIKAGHSSSASKSLEKIIRRSSPAATADAVTSGKTSTQIDTSDVAAVDKDNEAMAQANETDLERAFTKQMTQPFIGTVLEGHTFTPMPATPTEETTSPNAESLLPLVSDTKQPTATIESATRTSSDNTDDRRLSLSVFATWWSSNSTSPPKPTNLNMTSDQAETYTQEHEDSATPSTTATTAVSSSTAASTPPNTAMDWEPSGPEAAFIQRSLGHTDNRSSSSLPSSLPSSASFPSTMIKHSKLAASTGVRRGSVSSTQGSLSAILWSKFTVNQENVASESASAKDSTTEEVAQESTSTGMDLDQVTASGLAISPTHARTINTPANSGKKRWSLFGYGAKDEDEESSPNKLRKSGDVLIEPNSRPASVKETAKPLSTALQSSSADPSAELSLESTAQQPIAVKTELADSSDEGGPVAPALVGTSEMSVVVPPGTAVAKSNKESTPASSGTVTGAYSWLSIIPGYGNKTEDAISAADQIRANNQVTDYEEGERKDVNGNTVKLGDDSRQTLAELAEAKGTKEDLVYKDDFKDGQTFAQLKEREGEKNSIAKEAGKAMASLSKVILKKKNVVLPDYYEQYPDVRQSLITLPVGPMDVPVEGPRHQRSPSIMKSAVNALSSLLFSKAPTEQPPSSPPKDEALHRGANGIKKVAIIGVHGWFPVKLIRTVIGEPTGTSKKFCDEMNLALQDYLKIHDVELESEDITLIPLEGEGKVLDRVEILYQNLINSKKWRNALHEADLVLVATHSQGTPTSTILTARLIQEGILRVGETDPKMQRVGILAMAGISHGPFPFLKGNLIVRWFEAEAAQELFEFMDSETEISQRFREALRIVLKSGIRFTAVASLEDQVVPLYSAVMTAIHHPSIVRAVYIDGASYQDDFLTNLISFSLRLRNSGMDDHGVLVHLSEVVAGSIYGEGHSTIYEEREVYMLAIRALLEPPASLTSEMARSEPILHPFRAKQHLNPFYLPWGMRGVMDELKALGVGVLNEEMERLKKLYDDWNPATKGMKEIKFRLEPVRSKL